MDSFEQDLFLLRRRQADAGLVAEDMSHGDDCEFEADRDHTAELNLAKVAASSAVSACGEERAGAVRKSRVKRSPVKQEENTATLKEAA